MKKYVLLVLLLIPFTASAAPSVRVLGNRNLGGAAQIVPSKTDTSKKDTVKSNIPVRTGTLKIKTSGPSGVLTSSGSRFPVISPVKSYNTIKQPSATDSNYGSGSSNPGNAGTNTGSCNMCTDTINDIVNLTEDKVQDDLLKNYYDKTQVYNNNEFVNAVKEVAEDVDDPRIDAIRTKNPSNLHPGAQLPSDYVYMWIEQ